MNSGKVYMIVGGQLAMVPQQHADKLQKKEMLHARAVYLRDIVQNEDFGSTVRDVASLELKEIMGKIIRLNRRIPACVQFV